MKRDREQMLLEWYGGGDVEIEQLTDDDAHILLNALGITGASATAVVKDVNTVLILSDEPPTGTSFRNAFCYGLSQLADLAPLMARQAAIKGGMRVPLREKPQVNIPGHGTLCRAQSDRGVGGKRPHIYIWFKPLPAAPCNEYAWYQFAQVNLHVDQHNETDDIRGFSFNTSGGARMKMGEWRTDFIKESLDRVNAARKAAGKNDLPEFTPPNFRRSRFTTKKPKGKAYIGATIPGHRGDGVVDAPNLCYRGPNPTPSTASTLDRAANRYNRRKKKLATSQPDTGSAVISIVTNFRTYLVCVDPRIACIGYVEWTYTCTATYQHTWRRTDSNVLGGGAKWYRRRTVSRGKCSYTLTIGDFKPC